MMLSNLSQQNVPLKVRITSEAFISHVVTEIRGNSFDLTDRNVIIKHCCLTYMQREHSL